MIMTWRDREAWLNIVFCNDGRVVDEKERDENEVEDASGYEQSRVQVSWSGWEDLVSVLLHAGSGLLAGAAGIVN